MADDYAASTATTGTVAIGGSTTGNIETTGDADWFKVTLTAGETYQFKLEGSDTGQGTLQSPYLELRDGAGNHLLYGGSSDTGPGPGYTSLFTYTATTTGPYYLASNGGSELGTYKISAASLGAIADDYYTIESGWEEQMTITINDPNRVIELGNGFWGPGEDKAIAIGTVHFTYDYNPSEHPHTISQMVTDTDSARPGVANPYQGLFASNIETYGQGTGQFGYTLVLPESLFLGNTQTHTITFDVKLIESTQTQYNIASADYLIEVFVPANPAFTPPQIASSTIQNDYLGITRTALSSDRAAVQADAINAGTTTEFGYVNGLLSQVANTTIPAVAVEGSMYGAVGTSAEITKLVTQFLPSQIANAIQHGFNPQVYASEALGLAFAFGDENGGTAFASHFGPSNATMAATPAGDAAFAAAAASAIFGSAATVNTPGAILAFVSNWEAFFATHGVPGIVNATAAQIDLAARGAAWGDAVGVALANNLGPVPAQTTEFLMDAAQGIAIYSASLVGQPHHHLFQGEIS